MTDRCSDCGRVLPPSVYVCRECELAALAWLDEDEWDPLGDEED